MVYTQLKHESDAVLEERNKRWWLNSTDYVVYVVELGAAQEYV